MTTNPQNVRLTHHRAAYRVPLATSLNVSPHSPEASEVVIHLTIGERLQAAREALRASVYQASQDTKIRVDYIQSMERDSFQFAALPYVRGMLAAYARWLNLDSQAISEEFEKVMGPTQPVSPTQIFREPAQKAPRKPRSRWAIAAAFAALTLMALSFAGLVNPPESRVATPPSSRELVEAEGEPEITPSRSPQPNSVAQAPVIAERVQVALSVIGEACWIRVMIDGDDEHPVFSGTLKSGATKTFEAAQSIKILFGDIGAVSLIHNGKELGSLGEAGKVKTIVFDRESVKSLG